MLAVACEARIPTILDADIAETGIIDRLAIFASHIVFSHAGLARYSGLNDPAAALYAVAGRFPAFVAVTLGAEVCAWRSGKAIHRSPAVLS